MVGEKGEVIVDDYVMLGHVPMNMRGLCTNTTIHLQSITADDMGNADIVLNSDGLALYVILTTLAEGTFTDNAFLLRPADPPKASFAFLKHGLFSLIVLTVTRYVRL